MTRIVENNRRAMKEELDRMSDERLLNTNAPELEQYCTDKYRIDLPILGEPQIDPKRTKVTVDRFGGFDYGNHGAVQVDAEEFTLEVPFTGDRDLFFAQGMSMTFSPPHGSVGSDVLSMTVQVRDPNSEQLNRDFERFMSDVEKHLGWLKPIVDTWNSGIAAEVRGLVEHRRKRADKVTVLAQGLKFRLKERPGPAATFSVPVAPKRLAPVLPKPTNTNPSPEPVLTEEAYREILDTLQQMSEVMERSPHAYAAMDEETLRFQFLVALNARFEGEARGEVFNYGGKTDILITYRGRNLFIAELQIGPCVLIPIMVSEYDARE